MLNCQFSHFPGADEHNRFVRQLTKYFAGELNSGIADGNRAIADAGFGSDSFGDKKRAVQQAI